MFYAKDLSTTIAQAVEEHLQTDPSEQLALFEELALMRHTASSALKLYSAAMTTNDLQTQATAAELVRHVLGEVARMCEAASRVQAAGKDKFSIHNLAYVVTRITKIAYKVFGDDEEGMQKARQFEELIRNEVKLARDVEGTTITPDADVVEMDETIPRAG